jgi:alcohol dehydrogenase
MLREAGAREVTCCDIDPSRVARALDFGATRAVTAVELSETTGSSGRGVDAAIEFTGSSSAASVAINSLRVGGTAILGGTVLPSPAVPLDPELLVRRMLTIRGLHNYAPEDLVAAVRFLEDAQHRYPLSELVSESFPLESINQAFAAATKRAGFRIAVCP